MMSSKLYVIPFINKYVCVFTYIYISYFDSLEQQKKDAMSQREVIEAQALDIFRAVQREGLSAPSSVNVIAMPHISKKHDLPTIMPVIGMYIYVCLDI